MVDSLQERCYERIFKALEQAPPGIQEMVANDTRARMYERARQEMYPSVVQEVKSQLVNLLPGMVCEIMDDIIGAMTNHNRPRRNFRAENQHLCPVVVECAIQTAEEVTRCMEERYVQPAFPPIPIDQDSSDEEVDYPDSDDLLVY